MARTLLPLLFLLLSSIQVFANHHFPQLVVRGGLSDVVPTVTPTPRLRLRQFSNGTSTTSDDGGESPTPTPDTTTQIPPYVPPSTVVSGAAETTAAQNIAPIFWQVWNNRNLLNDDNTKQQYIDLVDNTKDNVENLVNNLSDKVNPPSECGQTSLKKRSLISGILNTLTSAASLVSCAESVVTNLADEVVKSTPDLDVVDLLTDTLNDIKTQLDDLDNNDDNQSQSQSDDSTTDQSSSTSSASSCTSNTVTDCTVDLYESTTFLVSDGTTTSSVSTSSSTACHTVTACSAEPTTVTTIISTAVSSTATGFICDVQHCANNVCPLQTSTPSNKRRAIDDSKPESGLSAMRKRFLKLVGGGKSKRALQDPVADGDNYNVQVCAANPGGELDWGVIDNPAVSKNGAWGDAGAFWMQGLVGCTGIIVTSKKGFWMVHMVETGFGNYRSNRDNPPPGDAAVWGQITGNIANGYTSSFGAAAGTVAPASLSGPGGILEVTCDNNVQVFVMTPGNIDRFDDDFNDLPDEAWYGGKVQELLNQLVNDNGAPLAGATIVDSKIYQAPGDLNSGKCS